ncbi:MAG TPA: cobalamin-binding protein [bacterium]
MRRLTAFFLFFSLFFNLRNLFADKVFIDEIGGEVRVDGIPGSIVSLAPSITEILFALGAGERIVGITDFCDYPDEAKKKEKIGGFTNPNIEKILSLMPDLVIGTKDGNDPATVKRIKNLGIPVYIADARDFEGIKKSILNIARVVNRLEEGIEIVNDMDRRLKNITADKKRSGRKVLFLYGVNPLIASGKNTFADNLISLAGGVNIFSDAATPYPKLNIEEILKRDPDIVVISEMRKNPGGTKRLAGLLKKKVYRINGDIVNRPGPRIIEGLEKLNRIINGSPQEI